MKTNQTIASSLALFLASCAGGSGSGHAPRDATPDVHLSSAGTWLADDHNYATGQAASYVMFTMTQSADAPADKLTGHVYWACCDASPGGDPFTGTVHGTIDGATVHLDIDIDGGGIVITYDGFVPYPATPSYIRGAIHVVSNADGCTQIHDTQCDLYFESNSPLTSQPQPPATPSSHARVSAWLEMLDGDPTLILDARDR